MRIFITREPMEPAGPGHHCARWLYSYSIDDAPAIQYGTHLGSLRGMLNRRCRGATVVAEWVKGPTP